MKPKHLAILAVAGIGAYLLWKRANDPARVQAQGDEALTAAAKLQAAGQPVPEALKQLVARVHGPKRLA